MVQIKLSPSKEILERIERVCEKLHIKKATWITMLVKKELDLLDELEKIKK